MTNLTDGFNIRNPASVRKLAGGIATAVLLAGMAHPTIRDVATRTAKESYNTILDLKTTYRYGEAGTLPYTAVSGFKLPYDTTPERIALTMFWEGNAPSDYIDTEDLRNLFAHVIAAKNNLPSIDSKIEADRPIIIPIYDPKNGRRLGELLDNPNK